MAAAEAKQQQQGEEAAVVARCADGGCRPYGSGKPMCAWCYAEKVVKPTEELEAFIAQIRRVPPRAVSDGAPPRLQGSAGGLSFRRSTRDCS